MVCSFARIESARLWSEASNLFQRREHVTNCMSRLATPAVDKSDYYSKCNASTGRTCNGDEA
ncbi:hypothetical protein PISMIDRAFT_372280 [Pisolithus microcarpus 441]|uniref:Unplaced genomic scaffold scaffold_288, whole genome shotgun sequence n=1 Tax=Pisolithus microcarpus 441 TaxID=765257 RepID=A0A0C9YJ43_9AGAM|nr:hypothetical protein PISMIDRAFT_372280 [Pisolithus microcarpus 441]